LTEKQTASYANDDDFRVVVKDTLRSEATETGEAIELHDVDGVVLEVFEVAE